MPRIWNAEPYNLPTTAAILKQYLSITDNNY